jgi:ATP-dependent helicase/nuclease subunit A
MQGRRKLYSRLGLAARDAIDELMNSALEFERNETASLDRFLAWFSQGTVDVQRDPGRPGNEVRVMTVHGAKGLEAPVVIIADATGDPVKLGRTPLTVEVDIGGGLAPLLRPKKEERCPPFEKIILAEERRDLEEHSRLLYVALTRAADRLIVGGVRPKEKKDGSDPRPINSWHLTVERAMTEMGAEPGEAHVMLRHGSPASGKARRTKDRVQPPSIAVPDWARQTAPPEARPPRPLAPSAMAVDDAASPPPSEAMRKAALRGTWIHQLLERLPAVDVNRRAAVADRWLERSAAVSDAAIRREIVDQVCGIISNPRFTELFGPDSLGEAPLAATLPDGRVIAGTVDRLHIAADRISVIDFKTGRVPDRDVDIPASHRAQMSAYVAALKVIFPGKQVAAALLYTTGPKLVEVMS